MENYDIEIKFDDRKKLLSDSIYSLSLGNNLIFIIPSSIILIFRTDFPEWKTPGDCHSCSIGGMSEYITGIYLCDSMLKPLGRGNCVEFRICIAQLYEDISSLFTSRVIFRLAKKYDIPDAGIIYGDRYNKPYVGYLIHNRSNLKNIYV